MQGQIMIVMMVNLYQFQQAFLLMRQLSVMLIWYVMLVLLKGRMLKAILFLLVVIMTLR